MHGRGRRDIDGVTFFYSGARTMGRSRSGASSAPAPAATAPTDPETKSPPAKLLVTGSSGHLGANLVRRLLADGHELRVLLRPHSDNSGVDGLPVERVYGDLRDAAAVD